MSMVNWHHSKQVSKPVDTTPKDSPKVSLLGFVEYRMSWHVNVMRWDDGYDDYVSPAHPLLKLMKLFKLNQIPIMW